MDDIRTFTFTSKVWLYSSEKAAWHFVNVPKKESEIIKNRFTMFKRGWGSFPVDVTIGNTTWKTSIFPDKKSGCYILPLKADVRKKEHIQKNNSVKITIKVRA